MLALDAAGPPVPDPVRFRPIGMMSKRDLSMWMQAIDDIKRLYEWRCELLWGWWKIHEGK